MQVIEKIIPITNSNINNDTFIFDIETTGLNYKYNKIILIGILYNCQNETIIKQFFAENENDEISILKAFAESVLNFNKHVTYNGTGFDINFINYRMKKNNIDFSLSKEDDFDILKFLRPFKHSLKLENCRLDTVEKYFNIPRSDLIDGKESINLYKEYLEHSSENIKNTILLHNFEDVYNLSKLIDIKDFIKDKLDLLYIDNPSIKIYPLNYKLNNKKLRMIYYVFEGKYDNISIYKDNYSIISDNDYISLEINVDKGRDKDENNIIFYNMTKIIPLKFNDVLLEKNINSLCNFILINDLKSI